MTEKFLNKLLFNSKMLEIPRLSIDELGTSSASNRLGQILENPGVVLITGLDQTIFDRLYEQARIFFDSPLKSSFMHEAVEEGYKIRRPYKREFFYVDGLNGLIRHLGQFPDFKLAIQEVYITLEDLSTRIVSSIGVYLDNRTPILDYMKFMRKMAIMKYPPIEDFPEIERNPGHPDPPCTLLPRATQDGLEVRVKDEWVSVPFETGTAVFMPGGALERYSDMRIRELWHRVRNTSLDLQNPRYAMGFSLQ